MEYSEADLEEYLAGQPGLLMDGVEGVRCVGRQVTLPSGRRLDLLLLHRRPEGTGWVFTIVEVKRTVADVAAVMQLLGYMDEFLSGLNDADRAIATVRGVVCAPSYDPSIIPLQRRLSAVTYVQAMPYFAVDVQGVKEGNFTTWDPDFREHAQGKVIELANAAIRSLHESEELDRQLDRRLRRFRALVPLQFTPQTFAHSNGRPQER